MCGGDYGHNCLGVHSNDVFIKYMIVMIFSCLYFGICKIMLKNNQTNSCRY